MEAVVGRREQGCAAVEVHEHVVGAVGREDGARASVPSGGLGVRCE